MRTHTNNDLRKEDIGKKVTLCGWVQSNRDHGGVIFIDLRDRYGLTQIVFHPEVSKENIEVADKLRREDVIKVTGEVISRAEGMENPKMDTGAIEVNVTEIEVINKATTPPMEVEDRINVGEDTRLKYRYIDLRRPSMQKNLLLRHNVYKAARKFFDENGFMEIETPLLVKSTPEGARDYLVPSRVNAGEFYALPQSPQLYKQILMISGVDKYFQLAKCLRDEDLRSDRQPEHTQMDFEMSFVDSEQIMSFVESLYSHIFEATLGVKIETPFVRMTYDDAMDKYGSDKPDIRYDLPLTEVSDVVKGCDFQVFNQIIDNGGMVKCINPPQDFGRKEIDGLIKFAQQAGAKGMAWMRVTENGLESNIAKFFSDEIKAKLLEKTGAKPGSILMFIADTKSKTNSVLDALRRELAKRMDLIDDKVFKFVWITDFPLFAWNEELNAWEPEHHMFSMPKAEFIEGMEENPGAVKGDLFDVALNGLELGSGSIRIHDPEIQKRVMKIAGISPEEAEEKFGFLLEAYKYGAPIHGGMGLGVDRMIAIMLGTHDIRETIAFPKNKNAQCPMDGCPGPVGAPQLKELHIATTVVKKAKEEAPAEKQE